MSLSPTQVVDWLREQANQLNRTADMIEYNFHSSSSKKAAAASGTSKAAPQAGKSGLTVEAIQGVIRMKSMRLGDLAKHFNVTPEEVKPYITTDNKLKFAERGWIKMA
ncbi:MAG: hypothetical protein WC661_17960 [Opitutaceae bacterium]|jgi:hypothetical protein